MRIRFHTAAAIIVLVASGAWVLTGDYSFVGSDSPDQAQAAAVDEGDAAASDPPADADGKSAITPQSVEFVFAKPSEYNRWLHLSGQTEADKQVVLVARASGLIDKLNVAEGDRVDRDGVVMTLNGPEKYSAVESAKAQFESAEHKASSDQQLRTRGTLPELQLEASIAAREAARSALEAARAELDRLQVHAPFGGIIDKVAVETGSWVEPGTQIATLLALDPIVVVGEVNERDLQSVGPGSRAEVTFGDGTTAEGEVRYVRREASGQTRTFPIEVAIDNPDAAIPAGMSAEIRLAVKTPPAIVLPRSAVTLDEKGSVGVRTLTEADKADFRKVTIVDDTPEGVVLSGVPEGTRVIVAGQDMVGNGERVAAVEASGQTTAGTGAE